MNKLPPPRRFKRIGASLSRFSGGQKTSASLPDSRAAPLTRRDRASRNPRSRLELSSDRLPFVFRRSLTPTLPSLPPPSLPPIKERIHVIKPLIHRQRIV